MTYNSVVYKTDELEELIEGCTQNNRAAQSKLYATFYPRMMGMVRRYFSDESQAEEILNNGFLKAFTKIDTYSFKGSFEGWLRKIIFHCISDYAQATYNYRERVDFFEKDEVVNKEIISNLYYKDLISLIDELPPATRTVFNMFAVEDLSHKEISKLLGISTGTTKWHVAEARKVLRTRIESLNLQTKNNKNG